MRLYLVHLAVSCLLLSMQRLHAQDSTLTQLISRNRTVFRPQGKGFAGPGWDSLRAAIRQSQFVLLGEEHGLAETAYFAGAVGQELDPAALVAEISPYEARQLNQLTAQPGLPVAYQQRYPFSLSFFSWTEEFYLAQRLRARQTPVIGIDQVYMGNAGHLLSQMATQAQQAPIRAQLRHLAAIYLAHDRQHVYAPGATGTLYLDSVGPADIRKLLALTATETPAVRAMAQALATSYAIYHAHQSRQLLLSGFSGHQARINLMKHNLLYALRRYQAVPAKPLPKLLFKFGTNHMSRDRAPLSNMFDVGNLVANLADAQNQRSLHLLVVGKQGTQNSTDSFDHARTVGPLTPSDNEYLRLFFDQVGEEWVLVDLRPLRQAIAGRRLRVEDPVLERSILGFDYLILIPQTTASGNY